MGVVNVTPDSFSDDGFFNEPEKAVQYALKLIEDGADILDIGGESTRPGAQAVSAEEELERILPVVEEIRRNTEIPISVDTYKAPVASAVINAGADIINDVSSLRFDPDICQVVSKSRAGLILMHMRGTPKNMQEIPSSLEIIIEIRNEFKRAVSQAKTGGVASDRIIVDPGIGFGKTVTNNLKILNQLSLFQELGFPVLIGTSRKSFIGEILGTGVSDRVFGTAASVAVSVVGGAHIVRVHDVREMRQVVDVIDSIRCEMH